MSKSIRRLRQLAFVRQSGLCCYLKCGLQTARSSRSSSISLLRLRVSGSARQSICFRYRKVVAMKSPTLWPRAAFAIKHVTKPNAFAHLNRMQVTFGGVSQQGVGIHGFRPKKLLQSDLKRCAEKWLHGC